MQERQDGASWMVQAAKKREALGLPKSIRPWSSDMRATGLSCTERVATILDLAAATHLKPQEWELPTAAKQAMLRHVYCDVSQNPARLGVTNQEGVSHALTTGVQLYSFARDGVVLPLELLMIQGHRRDFSVPEHVSSQQVRALAGEGICLPCLGIILWSIHLAKGF